MERLLTTEEVAEGLRVDIVTVRRLVARGELAGYRIGGEYRFRVQDVEDYLARNRIAGGKGPAGDRLGGFAELIRQLVPGRSMPGAPEQFARYTERARKVMTLANEEALRRDRGRIGTEHLLLGVILEGESIAARVLASLGVELHQARRLAEELSAARGNREAVIGPGLTPQAKRAFELSVEEAEALGHQHLGPEHMLLGLVRESEESKGGVIRALGLDGEMVRTRTIQEIAQSGGV
jgi:excisionase family DNA binding protein